jgi:hypothetical protein
VRIRRLQTISAAALMVVASGAVATLSASSAAADPPATLTAKQAQVRKCFAGPQNGAGIASFRTTAPSTGLIRVTLSPLDPRSVSSDWDVAVFDEATGRVVAASAGQRSYEIADGFVTAGDHLRVQGCRYAGSARTVKVATTYVAAPAPTGAVTQLVAVDTPSRADKAKLQGLDLDLTEEATDTTVDTVLHGPADADRLKAHGFTWSVKIPNLADHLTQVRREDAAYAAATTRSALPSGRTSYRRLFDYDYELKDLARRYPQLVKAFILPHRTIEGRDVGGIEIAPNVSYTNDGRPIFLNMGTHHAREWPSGESTMEWAYDLLSGYGHDSRTTGLMQKVRNIVIPIVNPDGFSVSREAQPLGDFSTFDYEMKRKNCNPADATTEELRSGLCPQNPAGATRGTDINRNYGGFWGGPGASTNWRSDTYRGAAPFSEPETQNIRELVSKRQITNLISNHTYSQLVLRPPGLLATGEPVDEPALARLGGEMAAHNGYANIRSYQLYDTTGTTEDWSYWVTGGFGYTIEIGGGEFHPAFQTGVVAEYLGLAPAAGAGKGGNREAYFAMLADAANSADHSTLTGTAPAGWTLRLHKEFQTPTSPVIQPDGTTGPALMYGDTLDTTFQPRSSGRFSWAVNPSTRPYVAGRYGRNPTAPPQAPIDLANPAGQPPENTGDPLTGPHEEVPFTIDGPPAADNGEVHVRINWTDPNTDWDLYIVDAGGNVVSQSASFGNSYEDAVLIDPTPGTYRAIIVNYDQIDGQPYDDWTSGTVTFKGPSPAIPGVKEAWTLTCERPGGSIATVRSIVVDRGQTLDLGNVCFDRNKKHH